jgi:rubrerythrin
MRSGSSSGREYSEGWLSVSDARTPGGRKVSSVSAGASRRLRDLGKSESRLLSDVRAHVEISRTALESKRDTTHIHPSEMAKTDWCPRETFFRISEEPKSDEEAGASFNMENVFEEGHEIHRKWQSWFWEMGVLFGWWECLGCEHYWEALSPQVCPRCFEDKDIIRYREVPIYSQRYRIMGHADGAIHDAKGKVLIEIKSIGVGTLRFDAPHLHQQYQDGKLTLLDVWKKIRRPFNSHLRQGNLYLKLMPEYEAIVFIYEYKPNQGVREFVVGRNSAITDPLLASCTEIINALRSGFPPDRPDWATDADALKCRSCPYRSTCWGIKETHADPPAQTRVIRIRKSQGGAKGARRRLGAATQA